MREKILIIIGILTISIAYISWDLIRTPTIHNGSSVNDTEYAEHTQNITTITESKNKVPDIVIKDLNGKKHKLHDFSDKIVILNFWATWCPPCIKELPSMLELADTKKDKVIFIAASVDESRQKIERFFKTLPKETQKQLKNKNVILVHDKDKIISQDTFQVIRYPETFIIGKEMQIHSKVVGDRDWSSEKMKNYIDTLHRSKSNS